MIVFTFTEHVCTAEARRGAEVFNKSILCMLRGGPIAFTSTEHLCTAEAAEGFETFILSVPLRALR